MAEPDLVSMLNAQRGGFNITLGLVFTQASTDEVHCEDPLELGDRLLLGAGELPDAGDVAADRRWPEVGRDGGDDRVDRVGVADVAAVRDGVPGREVDLSGGGLGADLVLVEAGDDRAVGTESARGGLPDPGCGPGHDGDPVVEAAHAGYFTTIGLTGLPTALVTGSGDASRKNEYRPSAAQSSASCSRFQF